MALEAALTTLTARGHALLDALTGLHTMVVADRPLEGDVVLVDLFGDSADDLVGWVQGALATVRDAQQALYAGDAEGMRRALEACQAELGQVAPLLVGDLLRYERIAELLRCGRTRGGEWRTWAYGVKQTLEGCLQPLFDLDRALAACWSELASAPPRPAEQTQRRSCDVGSLEEPSPSERSRQRSSGACCTQTPASHVSGGPRA